jgi:hypothetical protein
MCPPLSARWLALLALSATALAFDAGQPDWALKVSFPAEPKTDTVKAPSPAGDIVSDRFTHEAAGETLLLVRSVYPLAADATRKAEIYDRARADAVRGRGGEILADRAFRLGDHEGRELRIRFARAKRVRQMRFILIGSTLYALVHEQPDDRKESPVAAAFWQSLALRPGFEDPRAVEERERWREVGDGSFRVRYDATRWYRDPSDNEAGIFNFLRADQRAEAQLIIEPAGTHTGALDDAALAAAREGAESVRVKGKKSRLRHGVSLTELQFEARVEGATYVNHGCYYSGAGGQVQLRAWATDRVYREVAGDIEELLEGLIVAKP